MKYLFLVLILFFSMEAFAEVYCGNKLKSTEDLVVTLKKKVEASDLEEYTFTQTTTLFKPDGSVEKEETWYEAVRYPNLLRIDFGEPKEKNAILYGGDSLYLFKGGELKTVRPEKMEYLFFEGGIASLSKTEVMEEMKSAGYNTDIFRTDKFAGRKVYVIGAEKGDMKSKQVWIDQERLVQVRRIDNLGEDKVMEVQFNVYQEKEGHWLPKEITFLFNGKPMQKEVYENVVLNPGLKDVLFDPMHFFEWHWNGK